MRVPEATGTAAWDRGLFPLRHRWRASVILAKKIEHAEFGSRAESLTTPFAKENHVCHFFRWCFHRCLPRQIVLTSLTSAKLERDLFSRFGNRPQSSGNRVVLSQLP